MRNALLIGLDSFGEIERITDCYDTQVEISKHPIDGDLNPIHPTGTSDAIGCFAEALRYLEHIAEHAVEN